ncbi:MAG: ribonuclease HII [Bacteroides sp.]|nr:ribonuclease HII [Bacteroides sp.]MCM1379382.1 ribonuclease HII [Bacteroides sp.]MCM1445242.1 ribonuclease HII [Prevotella sp.]
MSGDLLLTSFQTELIEVGCDEAGRGCLAGPVFAAAVILPPGYTHPLLHDSKAITEHQREEMRRIIERDAVAWAVASCSAQEIDEINILRASIVAMHRALDLLTVEPQLIVVDGNRFTPWRLGVPYTTVVKGDAKYANIAAASILAKTHRDEWISKAAKDFPAYGWEQNKAYPTAAHREAIALHGPSPLHRMTFRLLPKKSV